MRVLTRLPQALSQPDVPTLQGELGVKELDKTPFDNLRNYLLPEEKDCLYQGKLIEHYDLFNVYMTENRVVDHNFRIGVVSLTLSRHDVTIPRSSFQ